MKCKKSKIIILSMLFIVIMCSLAFTVGAEEDTSTDYWIYKQMDIDEYRKDTGYTVPVYDETGMWLFAGWFTDETCSSAIASNQTSGTAYAKFVPSDILGLKAQINVELVDDDTTNDEYDKEGNNAGAIRFVTSVDTLNYSKVGFKIVRGNETKRDEEDRASNTVYQRLYATGKAEDGSLKTDAYKPEDLFNADASTYFKTWTYTKVPSAAYDTDITVTPYWITLDGTTVEGTTSIKTVNLGRSWVYINTSANADSIGEYGTAYHPFTNLADAIDAIVLVNNGKIVIQENGEISIASDFAWEKPEKTRNITIIGENQETSKLNFSAMSKLSINDGVVFDNMTLTLPTKVFANGNRFKIQENVVSENKSTSIYGGGESITVSETNVEIYAGSYKEVWGGGNKCTITNDIHLTIKNANIYDNSGGDKSRVFGSGANDTVKGDIFVTIGGTFNKSHDVADFERSDHSRYSSVHGAGSGTVEGSTYVYIEDEAEVDYVYGGGGASSEVKGTCHVELKGGTVFSIYGGGKGDNSTSAGKNADTSVIVTGGKVCQIIGGNGNSMTGNSYVEIAGGTVTRRIHGGCYNDVYSLTPPTHHVTGYSTVVIKDETAVASLSGDDAGITAGSRCWTEQSDEIGVLICNNDSYASLKGNILTKYNSYDYLVQANAGGVVSSIGERLRVVPAGENDATVRLDNSTTGELHAYMTSDGFRTLPSLNDSTGKREVYVVFGAEQLDTDTLDSYEAKVGGTHFDTLENAITEANTLSESGKMGTSNPVVTLLKDVTIESELLINENSNINVQSEDNEKHTITGTSATSNVFTVDGGTLTLNNISLTGGAHGIFVKGGGKLYSDKEDNTQGVAISNTAKKGLYGYEGIVDMYNLDVSGTGAQALHFETKSNATITKFDVTGTSGQVAVRIMTGSDVTLIEGIVNANKYYGIYIDGDSSKVTATDTKIKQDEDSTTALVGIKNSTAQFIFNQSENGEAYIDGQSYAGFGVDVIAGTFILNGGTIQNNKATNGAGVTVQKDTTFIMNGGTISNNTATEYGAGVYALGSFTMNGGKISDNTAKKGGGVYVPASSIFTMQGGTISANTATNAGTTDATRDSGGGVYVEAGATFNMNAPAEGATAGIIKENIAQTNQFGAGVLVKGVFNMNAGTISNHGSEKSLLAVEGAGVCLSGDSAVFTMNGGEISNNYASKAGVGVSMRDGSTTFTMNGGMITENHASGNVAGIVLRKGTFTMNEGATISNNTATGVGGGISMDGTATFVLNGGTFSGNIAENINNDINFTNTTAYIKVAKELTSDIHVSHGKAYASTTKIAEKQDDITNENFKNSMKYIKVKANAEGQWFVNEQGLLTKGPVVLQSTGIGYSTLSDAIDAATEGETITVLRNEEIASTLVITKDLIITSDKAVTISSNAAMAADMIKVEAGKVLTITGASEDAKMSFVANTKVPNVIHSLGTTQLTNVNITSGKIGVYIPSGSVVANNIVIQNSADKGLSLQAGASVMATGITVKDTGGQGLYFTGSDGKTATANISNFEVSGTGSASVRLMDYCNVTLTNGTITTTTWGIATGNKIKNNTLNATDVTVYAPQDLISGKKVLSIETVAVGSYDGVTVSAKEQ